MRRRPLLMISLAAWLSARAQADAGTSPTAQAVRFPDGFGSHPDSRIEWWYVTGALSDEVRRWGFQVTFFRASTGLAADTSSRFAARELIFAHAAVTDLQARRLRHDQRILRSGFGIAEAAPGETRLRLRDWSLARTGPTGESRYRTDVRSAADGFALALDMQAHAPPLLQGERGLSRKGPGGRAFSRYYSEPQLEVSGTLRLGEQAFAVRGRAWLDHEWSDAYLDPDAVGWDWIGMNLDDGSALMAFRIRRRDGGVHF
ncbi:MAG TPA: carotenoid 1,2-hydratase, partial [Caldimonas sp.]|nr:carotenoid 1,2-hydratase [Caldimonas sp.]